MYYELIKKFALILILSTVWELEFFASYLSSVYPFHKCHSNIKNVAVKVSSEASSVSLLFFRHFTFVRFYSTSFFSLFSMQFVEKSCFVPIHQKLYCRVGNRMYWIWKQKKKRWYIILSAVLMKKQTDAIKNRFFSRKRNRKIYI